MPTAILAADLLGVGSDAALGEHVSAQKTKITVGDPKNTGVVKLELLWKVGPVTILRLPVTVGVAAGSAEQKADAIANAINAAGAPSGTFGFRAQTPVGASVTVEMFDNNSIPDNIGPGVSIISDNTGEGDTLKAAPDAPAESNWLDWILSFFVSGTASGVSQDGVSGGSLTFGNHIYVCVLPTTPGMTASQAMTLMRDDLQANGVSNVTLEYGAGGAPFLLYTPTGDPAEFVHSGCDDSSFGYSLLMEDPEMAGCEVPALGFWGVAALGGSLIASGTIIVRRRTRGVPSAQGVA